LKGGGKFGSYPYTYWGTLETKGAGASGLVQQLKRDQRPAERLTFSRPVSGEFGETLTIEGGGGGERWRSILGKS